MPTNSESSWGYNAGGGGVDVGDYSGKSILFDHVTANNTSISRTTSGSDGNRKMWTQSVWVKKLSQGVTAHWECSPYSAINTGIAALYFDANDFLESYFDEDPSSGREYGNGDINARKHRDSSAWMHIVWTVDAANTVQKVYVNGVEETIASTSTLHPMNVDYYMNKASTFHVIGIEGWAHASAPTTSYANQFLVANFVHLDGTYMANAAAFTDKLGRFSPDTGEWVCIDPTGVTYGTHGFWLKFDDNTNDSSGNSNNWTNNNSCPFLADTPVNNFATWNPLVHTDLSFSKGNLIATGGSDWGATASTIALPNTGKWYYEIEVSSTSDFAIMGFMPYEEEMKAGTPSGSGDFIGYQSNDTLYTGGGTETTKYSHSSSADDIYMFAVDITDNTAVDFYIGVNGTWFGSGDPAAGSNPAVNNFDCSTKTWSPAVWLYDLNASVNFGVPSFAISSGNADGNGKGNFEFAPPTNFLALCSDNLPEIEIGQEADDLAHDYFNTVLYTGDTNSPRTISGVGFQPDLQVLSGRSISSAKIAYDAVRGAGSDKMLTWNTTSVEGTDSGSNGSQYGFLSAFNSDGFVLTDGSTNGAWVNNNTSTFVSWNWKAGNATLGTGDFTQGSLASTCSRNVDAGFSIVSYTGTGSATTVGHGLSQAPDLIIVKRLNGATDWITYHSSNTSAPETDYLILNTTDATADGSTSWNDTAPTSSVFTVGNRDATNSSSNAMIAYCWHSVDGFSKFGSYVGNGSATDGTFVYTGFEPAFLLVKKFSATDSWEMWDNKRSTSNQRDGALKPNDATTEATGRTLDFLSNGFKMYNANGTSNENATSIVYMAFSSGTGFKYGNAI